MQLWNIYKKLLYQKYDIKINKDFLNRLEKNDDVAFVIDENDLLSIENKLY